MTLPVVQVGVLLSGRGSNFEALLRAQEDGLFRRARIVCVASDKPDAPGLATARKNGLAVGAFNPKEFHSRADYEGAVVDFLRGNGARLVALAGYMRIAGKALLDAFPGAILNIHPSLLPAFPGLHAQRLALDYGVRITGCTVHFVDAGVDTGPIVGQRAVTVEPTDTEESLSARILQQEHELYAECLRLVTEHSYRIEGRRVIIGDVIGPNASEVKAG